jgi:hypothetical protein
VFTARYELSTVNLSVHNVTGCPSRNSCITFQVSPYEISGGQSGAVTGFPPSTSVSLSVPFHK